MIQDSEKLMNYCKQRGFVYPGSEIYGGLANSWDYGPLGVELMRNIKNEWWSRFVLQRDDMVGLDASLLMNTAVWQASGHLEHFSDPLVECKVCHKRLRADKENPDHDKECGGELTEPKNFNLMLKTHLGAVEDEGAVTYFRPETAQAMFVDFKAVLETSRQRVPFGIAQIGKAFRNEITPGNFIFRTREFEQMEIEYFIKESEWEKWFEYWLEQMKTWLKDLGLSEENLHYNEVQGDELAHYSKRTVDIEYMFSFGQDELYGLAYRTDHDLTNHHNASGKDLNYTDPITGEKYIPHVIEPTFGVNRTILAVLTEHYGEEELENGKGEKETRTVMRFPHWLAPYKIAVLPLSKKEELSGKAKEIASELRKNFAITYDETQSIGRRYRRQDEIGTPYCVTVDFDSLEDNAVTIRDRDSMAQERISVTELISYFKEKGLKSL